MMNYISFFIQYFGIISRIFLLPTVLRQLLASYWSMMNTECYYHQMLAFYWSRLNVIPRDMVSMLVFSGFLLVPLAGATGFPKQIFGWMDN